MTIITCKRVGSQKAFQKCQVKLALMLKKNFRANHEQSLWVKKRRMKLILSQKKRIFEMFQ